MSPHGAVRTSAPAKVILGGEHAVVYGVPALGVPLHERRTEVHLRESRVPGVRIWLADLPAPSESQMGFVASALTTIAAGLHVPVPDATLEIRTSVPLASGLGSSASLCVALARAMCRLHRIGPDPQLVAALAHAAEHSAHGRASGLDTAVIAWGWPLRHVRNEIPEPLVLGLPLHLVIAHSGRLGNTREVVMDVAARQEADPGRLAAIFGRIGEAVAAMTAALAAGDLVAAGAAMTVNQAALVDLRVSSPELDTLVAAADRAGAYGTKLTGAGRGGCIVALVAPERAAEVRAACESAGATWALATTVPSA